jgi:putative transposase
MAAILPPLHRGHSATTYHWQIRRIPQIGSSQDTVKLIPHQSKRCWLIGIFDTVGEFRTAGITYPGPRAAIADLQSRQFTFIHTEDSVQELLFERGIDVTYEAIRQWCLKFGQDYANRLRRRRPQPGDKWHLDEVCLTINGRRHYLWQAVDQDNNVLDILVQSRRNKKAAKKFFRKLLKGLRYVPRVVITDKLKSYSAAKREILPGVEYRQSRYLNNRCENSHRPTRQRERRMQGFKSPGHAQRFCRRMDPLPDTSDPGGIGCQRRRTAKRWGIDSRVGPKLQARSELPNGWVGPGRGTRLPDKRLNLNNLTKPSSGLATLVRPEGIEPPTSWFEARRSVRLSYGRTWEMLRRLLQNKRIIYHAKQCSCKVYRVRVGS